MMRTLGNKKNVKIISLGVAVIFILGVAGIAMMQMGNPVNAAPQSSIGVVDMSAVFKPDSKDILEAQQKIQEASDATQKEFNEKSANMSEEEKSKLFGEMQQQLMTKREEIQKGLSDKVDAAVKSVADGRGLTLVVDKRAVLYGGVDITGDVAKKLSSN